MTFGSKSLVIAVVTLGSLSQAGAGAQASVASWYGPGFHGRKTASGERFNTHAYTAAHKSLPFGTRLKVTNVGTGRSVVVRVNDRGPFVRGRELDLSHAAARAIGMSGVAQISIARL